MRTADCLEPDSDQTLFGMAEQIRRDEARACIAVSGHAINVHGWEPEAARRGRENSQHLLRKRGVRRV